MSATEHPPTYLSEEHPPPVVLKAKECTDARPRVRPISSRSGGGSTSEGPIVRSSGLRPRRVADGGGGARCRGIPEQRVAEPAAARVESIEAFDGDQPDFLANVLGGVAVPAEQVVDQTEDVADVVLVHRLPTPSGHAVPSPGAGRVRRPSAAGPAGLFPPPDHRRSRRNPSPRQ